MVKVIPCHSQASHTFLDDVQRLSLTFNDLHGDLPCPGTFPNTYKNLQDPGMFSGIPESHSHDSWTFQSALAAVLRDIRSVHQVGLCSAGGLLASPEKPSPQPLAPASESPAMGGARPSGVRSP